uniref:Uncharacterized protein n=1 Tax=Romanomermis culicivorax TaxID=13658 RepID=A0A915LBU7_ROMCU
MGYRLRSSLLPPRLVIRSHAHLIGWPDHRTSFRDASLE